MSFLENYLLLGIFGMGVVTFATRALPFLPILPKSAVARLESRQAIFPPMLLTLLVVYCLEPCRHATDSHAWSLLGSALYVGVAQWYRGNLFLSLGVGTLAYLLLVN